jgi:hypothetical protein
MTHHTLDAKDHDGSMSHLGQTEKHSARADVFRSSPKNGRWFRHPKYYAVRMLWNFDRADVRFALILLQRRL